MVDVWLSMCVSFLKHAHDGWHHLTYNVEDKGGENGVSFFWAGGGLSVCTRTNIYICHTHIYIYFIYQYTHLHGAGARANDSDALAPEGEGMVPAGGVEGGARKVLLQPCSEREREDGGSKSVGSLTRMTYNIPVE